MLNRRFSRRGVRGGVDKGPTCEISKHIIQNLQYIPTCQRALDRRLNHLSTIIGGSRTYSRRTTGICDISCRQRRRPACCFGPLNFNERHDTKVGRDGGRTR